MLKNAHLRWQSGWLMPARIRRFRVGCNSPRSTGRQKGRMRMRRRCNICSKTPRSGRGIAHVIGRMDVHVRHRGGKMQRIRRREPMRLSAVRFESDSAECIHPALADSRTDMNAGPTQRWAGAITRIASHVVSAAIFRPICGQSWCAARTAGGGAAAGASGAGRARGVHDLRVTRPGDYAS